MASAPNQQPDDMASGVDEVDSTNASIQRPLTSALTSLPNDEPGLPDHVVQFYETDDFLVEQLAKFASEGLQAGEACVIIATESLRKRVEKRLENEKFDLRQAQQQGTYITCNAETLLPRFMVDGTPDPERFNRIIGTVISRAARGSRLPASPVRHVRAYGEVASLLWATGNQEAALRLEELWNELAAGATCPPFTLLCSYPMSGFAGVAHAAAFRMVCENHAQVFPGESYSTLADSDERLRTITTLQQKASSLDTEIAQREEVEERLRVSEHQYRRLFESSTDGILVVDAETHTIMAANPVAAHLLGWLREDLLGQDLWFVGLFPDLAVAEEVWRELEECGVARLDTMALPLGSGSQMRYVDFVSNRFRPNGHYVVQCHLRDVTERTQVEQAQRELEARKDAFISMASHELRTPITSLKAFTQILQRRAKRQHGEADLQLQQVLGRMDVQLDRLTHLVTDLLDLSKMQVGSLAFRDTCFDVDALVHETVETMQAVTTTHTLSAEGSTSAHISGDRDRLGQVLINLLSNASKYSPDANRIVVRLRATTTHTDDGDQQWVEISVQDFGIGIAPEHQHRVFERFYQVGASEGGSTYPGLGIGLHIARTIVERHGGRLWMESHPGDGSTFYVRLPVANGDDRLSDDDGL